MASKGPKSGAANAAAKAPLAQPAKPVEAVVVKPAIASTKLAKPAARPAAPRVAPTAVAPAPIVPQAAPAPVVAPVAVPAPVITPAAPAAVVTVALTQKEDIMEAVNTATDQTQAQAHAMFNDANDRAKSAMEKGSKMIEDMNAFSKGNLEALAESTKIAAKGAEDVARYTTDYARAAVEKANATARQFAAVKSPTELFKLQGDLAKEAMDQVMAETAKFTENYLKLLGEIAQPLSNRVAVAAEKMKIAA